MKNRAWAALLLLAALLLPAAGMAQEETVYVTFGHYEQDNDLTNGKEPIEWRVLKEEGGEVMLITRYALDAKPYNETAGYRIVARNWRFHRNEIDIIAMDGDTLVFVEVKKRQDSAHGYGCEAVDHAKQQRIRRVAEAYLACTKRSQADTKCRFDVVSIDDDKILLFKNAF